MPAKRQKTVAYFPGDVGAYQIHDPQHNGGENSQTTAANLVEKALDDGQKTVAYFPGDVGAYRIHDPQHDGGENSQATAADLVEKVLDDGFFAAAGSVVMVLGHGEGDDHASARFG
ncbi:hypothetical protein [Spongiactinospora sp. 9N601]|uniref:hypothetical protein n=1 Tax=Spongiactinospora sp. 9N601 TaxID=3375149 RepID=UPI00378B09F2